jgi:hypothetical protein
MEAGFVALFVVVAILVGIFIGVFFERKRKIDMIKRGTIYAYRVDENSPWSLMLEYDVPIDDIASQKRVLFDVSVVR